MRSTKEDNIPLVAVKPNKSNYLRTTSCFEEPEESALNLVLNNDLTRLSDLLAEISPDDKGNNFPLPDDHWINKPWNQSQNYKTLIHIAMEQKNPEMVHLLLKAGAKSDVYNDILGLTPLHVAIKIQNKEILEILLKNKANIDGMDQNGRTALHLATESNDLDLIQVLLDYNAQVDPEDALGRITPLYIAAKGKYSEATKLLISYGASPLNTCFGKTIGEIIEESMPYFDISKVDIIKKPRRNSIKDYGYALAKILDKIQISSKNNSSNKSQNLIQFKTLLNRFSATELDNFNANGMNLLQKSCNYGLEEFANLLLDHGADPNKTIEECGTAPVLFAAYHGHFEVLNSLIQHKMVSIESVKTTDFSLIDRTTEESVLHYLLKIPNRSEKNEIERKNYEKCLNALLDCEDSRIHLELLKIINHKDLTKNVPLHYATNLWPQIISRKLLERGANIGIRNIWDELPISKIMPETMENFLDEVCIQSNGQPVTSEDLELTFDYSFLAPPLNLKNSVKLTDEENQDFIDKQALPETECLWYMAQSESHRHLLKHPVVTSFLWLKWQKIRGYFNRNLRFYLLFVMIYTWYIFARFGGISTRNILIGNNSETKLTDEFKGNGFCSELSQRSFSLEKGFWFVLFCIHFGLQMILMMRDWKRDILWCCKSATGVLRFIFITSWLDWTIVGMMVTILILNTKSLWTILTILLLMMICRELFQMSVSLKRYIFTPENWIELLLIGFVGIILWIPDSSFENPCTLKRHLAAISLVLAWAEMITLVARHPKLAKLNIYVTMFYRVLRTFTLFLVWYSFFVIAFALGFYIMLHEDIIEENDPKENINIENFSDETKAILAKLDKETQELDDYPFFNHPWHSFIKTTIMFVGEIEFSDLPIDMNSWLSFLFLLAFVFLIIVVLMNLLNGLAVSDTGLIREQAEIVSHIARVDTISYTESILLGDPLDFLGNWPPFKWVINLPSLALMRCLFQNKTALHCLHRITGASRILLFYTTLPDKKAKSCPNKKTMSCLSLDEFPREINSAAIQILIQQENIARKTELESDDDQSIKNQLKKLEAQLNLIMTSLKLSK